MRTVYRTTGRYGGHRSLHTERDCPLLNKGKNIISTEVETIDDEDLCSYCEGDEDWNQGEDDLSYQRALKQADPETPVTDGGEEIVWTHSTGAGESITVYHTDRDCPSLGAANSIVERNRNTLPERATHCQQCADRLGEREFDPDWSYQNALRNASNDDLVTDGGMVTVCPECGNTHIYRQNPDHPSSPGNSTDRWYCATCQETFDEPTEREPRAEPGLRGLAGALDEADPEDVGRGSMLQTDGGRRDRGIEYPDRDAGLYWFDHASAIARFRVRAPHAYTENASDYVDTLCWAFASWYRNPSNPDASRQVQEPDEEADETETEQTRLITDGGRPRQRRVDQVVAAVLEDGPTPSDHLRDQLRADGGEQELPERDQAECERRAQQAGRSLLEWSDRADLDPILVLKQVQGGDAR